MNFKALFAVLLLHLAVSGCATSVAKELVATGGSRADGTVQLSFEHAAYEQPKVDFARGIETARSRCAAWGYGNAEQFGGVSRQCQFSNNYGCMRWHSTVTYQCIGRPEAPPVT